jgi:hypothetical protein
MRHAHDVASSLPRTVTVMILFYVSKYVRRLLSARNETALA